MSDDLDEIRALARAIEAQRDQTWGCTPGGASWTTSAALAVPAFRAVQRLLAVLDTERESAKRVVEAAARVARNKCQPACIYGQRTGDKCRCGMDALRAVLSSPEDPR